MSRKDRKKVKRKAWENRSRFQRFLLRFGWILPVGAILIGVGVLLLTYAFASLKLPPDVKLPSSAAVYDVHGNLIGTYTGEVRRFLIDTSKLPKFIGEAVISAEDKEFYKHNGVSLRGIVRAGWANLTGGEIQQGGSTITQQYVKNAILQTTERTISRKIKEAVYAIKLERRFSKKQILGFYLNTIYLGRGAYGIEAAASSYFGYQADPLRDITAAEQLKVGEAAYLAGIIPAPESYQPNENPRAARQRRNRVLRVMHDEGYITEKQMRRNSRGRVKTVKGDPDQLKESRAAYFMEWLRKNYLYPEYGKELYTRGLKIYTTLDLEMQEAAEEAVSTYLTEASEPQAALVSMTPLGEVRAYVGGRSFRSIKTARGFDYASDYPGRQAGSAFKPFTLMTAIEENISPRSTFSGHSPKTIEETTCSDPDGSPWTPENYGGSSYGNMDLVSATTNSVNTVYAELAAEIGPDKIVDVLDDFQFDRPAAEGKDKATREIPEVCSLSLGILDVTPTEMARAYAGFANRGSLPEVMPLRYITDSEGNCVKEYRRTKADCSGADQDLPDYQQVVKQNSADVLNEVLTHVTSEGTATAAALPGWEVSGKTGTTQENVDAWFAGSVPQLTTVVWMGYPAEKKGELVPQMGYCGDPELCRPVQGIEVTGGSFPARIWNSYMTVATAEMEPEFWPTPEDLPDEILNEPDAPVAVPSATPSPSKSAKPSPLPEPSPSPVPSPTPDPSPNPTPDPSPTPLPSPQQQKHSRSPERRGSSP
jgi:penicillin-binding protein 1A